jgi:hypothetical protein
METARFLFMQVTALLFVVFQFFVMGAAFGGGAWVVWRALDRRAGRLKNSADQDGQPRQQPSPLS